MGRSPRCEICYACYDDDDDDDDYDVNDDDDDDDDDDGLTQHRWVKMYTSCTLTSPFSE